MEIGAIDPMVSMQAIEKAKLTVVAAEVRDLWRKPSLWFETCLCAGTPASQVDCILYWQARVEFTSGCRVPGGSVMRTTLRPNSGARHFAEIETM